MKNIVNTSVVLLFAVNTHQPNMHKTRIHVHTQTHACTHERHAHTVIIPNIYLW